MDGSTMDERIILFLKI